MIYIRRSAIQYIYIDIYFVINEMENLSNEEQACQQVISRSTFFFRLLLLPVPPHLLPLLLLNTQGIGVQVGGQFGRQTQLFHPA